MEIQVIIVTQQAQVFKVEKIRESLFILSQEKSIRKRFEEAVGSQKSPLRFYDRS